MLRKYFIWKYGGLPAHLKNPLGWIPWNPPPLHKRISYYIRKTVWKVDTVIYQISGLQKEGEENLFGRS